MKRLKEKRENRERDNIVPGKQEKSERNEPKIRTLTQLKNGEDQFKQHEPN